MINEKLVRELVEEKIAGTDYFILDLSIRPGNNIFVEIESIHPVSINDCVDISRQVEHNLDREAEDFSLQVSSPGLDSPLRDYRQYIKNKGRQISIIPQNGEEFTGTIKDADEEGVVVAAKKRGQAEGSKKKIWIESEEKLKYSDIKQAKIIISFK